MSRPQLGPAFPCMCPLSLVDQMAFPHGAQGLMKVNWISYELTPKCHRVSPVAFYWSNQVTRWAGFKGREIDFIPVGGGLLCAGRRELLAPISVDTHTHLPPYINPCCLHANLSKEGLSLLLFVPFLR